MAIRRGGARSRRLAEAAKAPTAFAELEAIRRYENKKGVCYKTVETFAGICRRKLWLVNDTRASTNGHEIRVPLQDPNAYQLTEHEISHILFRSDSKAKVLFIAEYTKKVLGAVQKAGLDIPEKGLAHVVDRVIGIVEDHRVDKLWGLLYPGSFVMKKEMDRGFIEPIAQYAHESILLYMSCIEAAVETLPGDNDRFRPYILEAFRKVEHRGFSATLVVSKWLITMLVNELIREAQGLQPPEEFPDESVVVNLPMPMVGSGGDSADQGDGELSGEGDGGGAGSEGDEGEGDGDKAGGGQPKEDEVDENKEGDGDGEEGDDKEDGDGQQPWEPPKVDADLQERAEALQKLLDKLDTPQSLPNEGDFKEPKYQSWKEKERSERSAAGSVRAQVVNSQKMEGYLDASAREMEKILSEARNALRAPLANDEWIRKDAMARLVFKDVRPGDVERTDAKVCLDCNKKNTYYDKKAEKCRYCGGALAYEPLMSQEDLDTVMRLRGIFNKIMGRKKTELVETGAEINPQAYIEFKLTGIPVPCFVHHERGRGFKAMILLDRSGSMNGNKTEQAERACRIIGRALRYPFVEFHIWGFQSLESGQVDISRFDPRLEVFSSPHSNVSGVTPLHVACRVGARFLEQGSEAKQLFVITDGEPVYSRRDGKSFSQGQLQFFVREDIRRARKHGTNVTGVMIGSGWMPDAVLHFMFGPKRCWKVVEPANFGSSLVKLVSSSFIHYLKTI